MRSRWMAAWCAVVVLGAATACVDGDGRESSGTTLPGHYAAGRDTAAAPVAPVTSASGVAAAFLGAWAAGDLTRAASFTNTPGLASTSLATLGTQLGHPTMTFAPGAVPDNVLTIPFAATLTWEPGEVWTYQSAVPLVADGADWKVKWSTAVLHPKLAGNKRLDLVPVAADQAVPLDRRGSRLSTGEYPSLAKILGKVTAVAPGTSGSPGKAVSAVDTSTGAATLLVTLTPAGAPTGPTTTIDAGMQAAAERAVAASPGQAGLVVLQPSTGHILAMANNPPGQQNYVTSMQPPGSTMKVVVAAALLDAGDGIGSVVPCPITVTVDGRVFRNDDAGDTNPQANLQQDFAVSCNTAFIGEGRAKLTPAALSAEAANTFGLTRLWDIGLNEPRVYASVPDPGASQTEWAASLIGQGKVEMTPLAMASVAATVANGSFHQPVLLAGAPRAAANGLSPATASSLRTMMRTVVTSGTAASLRGLPGDVGAKTGTAQTATGTNGWIIAYRGDLAVACEVIGGATGDRAAGPVVEAFLRSIPT